MFVEVEGRRWVCAWHPLSVRLSPRASHGALTSYCFRRWPDATRIGDAEKAGRKTGPRHVLQRRGEEKIRAAAERDLQLLVQAWAEVFQSNKDARESLLA